MDGDKINCKLHEIGFFVEIMRPPVPWDSGAVGNLCLLASSYALEGCRGGEIYGTPLGGLVGNLAAEWISQR